MKKFRLGAEAVPPPPPPLLPMITVKGSGVEGPPAVQWTCPCIRVRHLLCFSLPCLDCMELRQLSCLRSSVGRASHLECVKCGCAHCSSEKSCLRVCVLAYLSFQVFMWKNTNGKEIWNELTSENFPCLLFKLAVLPRVLPCVLPCCAVFICVCVAVNGLAV